MCSPGLLASSVSSGGLQLVSIVSRARSTSPPVGWLTVPEALDFSLQKQGVLASGSLELGT